MLADRVMLGPVLLLMATIAIPVLGDVSSPFLKAFLGAAVWRSELDIRIPIGEGETVLLKQYTCSNFVVDDIRFEHESMELTSGVAGISKFSGLGMRCELDVEMHSEYGMRPVFVTLNTQKGAWETRLEFAFNKKMVEEVKLAACQTHFIYDEDTITITGLNPIPAAIFRRIYSAIAPILGPKVVNPLFCGTLGSVATVLNTVLQASQALLKFPKAPKRLWPNYRNIEKRIKPKSTNSSLLLAPYDESVVFKVVSGIMNDMLGTFAYGKSPVEKNLVINKLIREKLMKGKSEHSFEDVAFSVSVLGVPVRFAIEKATVKNLDSFSRFLMLKPVSILTLDNELIIQGPVDYNLEMSFEINPGTENAVRAPFAIQGHFQKLNIRALLLFALDAHNALKLNLDHFLGCFMAAVDAIELPRVELSIQDGSMPKFSSLNSKEQLGNLFQLFLESHLWPVTHGFSQETVNLLLRELAWYGSPLITYIAKFFRECHETPLEKARERLMEPEKGFLPFDKFPVTAIAYFSNNVMTPSDDPDFSISRVMEILVDVLSLEAKSEGNKRSVSLMGDESTPEEPVLTKKRDGILSLQRTLTLGPYSLLSMFPSLGGDEESGDEPPSFELSIGNITVGPLNEFVKAQLLMEGASPYSINNEFEMNQKKPLNVQVDVKIALRGMVLGNKPMLPAFRINVGLKTVELAAGIFMRLNPLGMVSALSLEQMMSSCIAFAFPRNETFKIETMLLDMAELQFRMDCQDSPCKLESTQRFVEHISTPEANEAMKGFLLNGAKKVAKVFSGEDKSYFDGLDVPKGTDQLLRDLKDSCMGIEHPKPKPPKSPSWIPPMNYFMLISALGLTLQFGMYMYYMHRNHQEVRRRQSGRLLSSPLLHHVGSTSPNNEEQDEEGNDSASGIDSREIVTETSPLARWLDRPVDSHHIRALWFRLLGEGASGEHDGEHDTLYLLGLSKPLFRHPAIHPYARYGIALGLAVNFGIFVLGVSFFTMGTITIIAQFGEERLKSIPMMSLTLDACIDMMVEGRALLFALFIGLSSGVFPWIRVAVLAFVWLGPPTILPVGRRERLVERLEAAGKWSLAEVYLFSVLMTIVSVEMTNPSAWSFLPHETFKANIECMPQGGVFIFLIATWVSLILNHAIVFFHRQAKAKDATVLPRPQLPPTYDDMKVRLERKSFPALTTALIVLWPIALFLGLYLHTLRVKFLGFSGFGIDMMKETGESVELSVSLSGLFPLLVNSDPTRSVNPFGLFLMCFGYALFILIAPPLCCLLCCFIWFAPLRQKHRANLLTALRILNAWSTIEVLTATIVVIVLQLHRFFDAMSGMITFLPSWIGPLLKDFGASDDEATGFGVTAKLEYTGFVFLFIASLLGAVLPRIVYRALDKGDVVAELAV